VITTIENHLQNDVGVEVEARTEATRTEAPIEDAEEEVTIKTAFQV